MSRSASLLHASLLLVLAAPACERPDPSAGAEESQSAPAPAIDLAAWRRGAAETLSRAEAVRDRARHFDPDAALQALRPPAGEGLRLDLSLGEARAEPALVATGGGGGESCARCWSLEFEGDDPAAVVARGTDARAEDGRLVVDHRDGGYLWLEGDYALPADEIGEVEIRARHARGTTFRLAWFRKPFDESWLPDEADDLGDRMGVITVDTVPGDVFHVYRVDARTVMRRKVRGDAIRSLALVPSNADGDRVEIESIRVVPKLEAYAGASYGVGYETLDNELRPVVYVHPPQRLEWSVDVPEEAPELRGGVATLAPRSRVRFSVAVAAEGAPEQEIWAREVTEAERWSPLRLDLARFAGRRVKLALVTEGEGENVALWSSPRVSARPDRRFNVIVLLEDTLRADRLSLYGHTRPTSPERERLGASGVTFESAFSQATKTRPSCPSLMTSLYPTATGVWFFNEALSERYVTLAEILRARGFETAAFVQNGNGGAVAGLHQGYDQLFNAGGVRDTPRLFEPALEWIEGRGERNFFLYLHARDPHGAYDPPPPYDRWYRELGPGSTRVERSRLKLDPKWLEEPTAEGRSLLYDGEVLHNDVWIGKLLARLEALGLREDTLIVTIADHGEHLGERGRWGHRPPSHRWVIHVPLVVSYPRALPEGLRIAHPVELVDVMPTILELARVDTTGLLLHGDSLVPLMDASPDPGWRDRLAVSEEVTGYSDRRAEEPVVGSVFFRDLHVLETEEREADGVYAYVTDRAETSPLDAGSGEVGALAGEARALLEQLKQTNLDTWRALAGREAAVIRTDPDVREQLRALGYVE